MVIYLSLVGAGWHWMKHLGHQQTYRSSGILIDLILRKHENRRNEKRGDRHAGSVGWGFLTLLSGERKNMVSERGYPGIRDKMSLSRGGYRRDLCRKDQLPLGRNTSRWSPPTVTASFRLVVCSLNHVMSARRREAVGSLKATCCPISVRHLWCSVRMISGSQGEVKPIRRRSGKAPTWFRHHHNRHLQIVSGRIVRLQIDDWTVTRLREQQAKRAVLMPVQVQSRDVQVHVGTSSDVEPTRATEYWDLFGENLWSTCGFMTHRHSKPKPKVATNKIMNSAFSNVFILISQSRGIAIRSTSDGDGPAKQTCSKTDTISDGDGPAKQTCSKTDTISDGDGPAKQTCSKTDTISDGECPAKQTCSKTDTISDGDGPAKQTCSKTDTISDGDGPAKQTCSKTDTISDGDGPAKQTCSKTDTISDGDGPAKQTCSKTDTISDGDGPAKQTCSLTFAHFFHSLFGHFP
ncbi:hypothetical protein RRG08_020741 [Elysia crispata]|uniref:Uncharacterized protein n=1 Tax=Elysia crispata TaxID=231223 RepID=A0AAE1E3S9_9GAST|nr:hypothetical protein RRG08_020741 [Elysia crispata]